MRGAAQTLDIQSANLSAKSSFLSEMINKEQSVGNCDASALLEEIPSVRECEVTR